MLDSVLVPLDGSRLSETALAPALELARQSNGRVYLMRVPSDAEAQPQSDYDRDWDIGAHSLQMDETADYLRQVQARLAPSGLPIKTLVAEGDRAQAIVDTAADHQVALIIMATHARSGISRVLLGSVCGRVVRLTNTPVLIIRKPALIRHVLVTLDGSTFAESAIAPAMAVAGAFDGDVTFLRVTNAPQDDAVRREAVAYLESRASIIGGQPRVTCACIGGPVTDAVLAYAKEHSIDLIAMSTHGRSGLRRLVMGSLTETLLGQSQCNMLIVRPTGGDAG